MDPALVPLVWERAAFRCEYCRMLQKFDEIPFEIDHIIAKKHHGLTLASNLALSCFPCNSFKGSDIGSRDLLTRRFTPFFHPRRHKWERHFRWDGSFLVGRTPIGRVTVDILNINEILRVELRKQLIEDGVFP